MNIGVGRGTEAIIGVCYKSPSATREEEQALFRDITSFSASNNPIMIMGDFNYEHIDWESLQAECINSDLFLETVSDALLIQHVEDNTRGSRLLDLVFSSEQDVSSVRSWAQLTG